MMRVLHLLSSNSFSGAENVVCQIMRLFRGEIDMVYCSPDGPIKVTLQQKKIKYIPLERLTTGQLNKVIHEYKPDIIHAHDVRASVIASQYSKKVMIISHLHCRFVEMSKITVKSLLYQLCLAKFSHVFTVSNSIRSEYVFSKALMQKSSVLYNAIDEKVIKKMAEHEEIVRYDGVFLGRFSWQKNPQRLIKIIGEIVKKLPDARFVLIGKGSLLGEAKELTKKLNLQDNITFTGYLSNPFPYLRASRFMLMTSRLEGTPMCILEAMTLGIPVVSTGVDGIKELIQNGVDGFYTDEDAELVEYACQLIVNDRLRHRLSQNVLEKSRAINNLVNYKKKLRKVYQSQAFLVLRERKSMVRPLD
ncbi:glycosyltransferase [Robertmurraya sp. DFI.2.37]|uniref:glycosyltransferase n=1 Tax=Robertmurraya sp. DFI.2.37 TaxID=3031819 RepID=UPI001243C35F|nr:glycosyltransferase [Robertmurraya sp. DFI.2.37]MDF1508414.1 glycosyltransferase [Robertmurraya sp. DFI.2.37]